MIFKREIAQEVAEEVEDRCPGIDVETVLFCVDSVIESTKKVMEDDTDNTVSIIINKFGSLYMDYYISLSKLKEKGAKTNPDYNATLSKQSFLKNFKKGRKKKSREKSFYTPILKDYYENLSGKRIRYIHSNFYMYWKQIAENHNKEHEL